MKTPQLIPVACLLFLAVPFLNAAPPSASKTPSAAAHAALWAGKTDLSKKENIPVLPSTRSVVNQTRQGEFQFTLGADIIFHDGEFIAQWANSKVDENDPDTLVRASRSKDGVNWSALEVVAPDFDGPGYHSHGVFLASNGELWSFNPQIQQMPTPLGRYRGLKMDAFLWNKQAGAWQPKGKVCENFWPLNRPIRLSNGNWLVAGGANEGNVVVAAVAISKGDDLSHWKPVKIPHPAGYDTSASKYTWGETSVFAEGNQLIAIVRNPSGKHALYAVSNDNGETWSTLAESNIPMGNSKALAGTLADGRHYLIYNYPTRDTLIVAFTAPGSAQFTQAYRIIDEKSHAPRWKGDGKKPQWAYPNATEHDGKLYIVYSVSKEDTGMTVVDVSPSAKP